MRRRILALVLAPGPVGLSADGAGTESARPDSHDWTSFRLELERVERMDPFRWQSFPGEVLSRFVRSAPARSDAGQGAR